MTSMILVVSLVAGTGTDTGTGKWVWPPPQMLPEPLHDFELKETACTPPEVCKEKCASEAPRECVRAALGYDTGKWKDKHNKDMGELFYQACGYGYGPACHRLGMIFWKGIPQLTRDEQASAGYFGRGCQATERNLESCFNFAMMNWRGIGVAQDDHAAEQLFDMLCRGTKNQRACVYKGMVLTPDDVEWAEPERSAPLFDKACKEGDALACSELGFIYERGMGKKKDEKRARALYDQACLAEVADGCYRLGGMLAEGRGGKKDASRAAELFERACAEDHPTACGDLARFLEKTNPKRALELYAQSCSSKDPVACQHGARLLEGSDLPDRHKRAFAMQKTACKARHAPSCTRVGHRYETGSGCKKDYRYAVDYYQRGCAEKDGEGCTFLGDMHAAGRGVGKDEVAALNWYRRGCAVEHKQACKSEKTLRKSARARAEVRHRVPKAVVGRRCERAVSLEACLLREDGFDQLTLPEALLVASGVSKGADLNRYNNELQAMAYVIAAETERVKDPIERANALLRTMHSLYLVKYDLNVSDLRTTIDSGRYNCLTGTLIYLLAARQAGLPASAYAMHGHVLAVVFTTAGPNYIETTNPDIPARQTWDPPLPEELYDWTGWKEVKGRVKDLLEEAALHQVANDEAGGDELFEEARDTFFAWFYRGWAVREALRKTAYDVSNRALASLLYWNRSIDAAMAGDTATFARRVKGILTLAEEKMVENTVNGMLAELRAMLLAQGQTKGWARAVATVDTLADGLEAAPRTNVRDLRAAVYMAWLRAARGKRCHIVDQLKARDKDHPVVAELERRAAKWGCR